MCFLLTTERIDGGFPKYTHYKTFLNGEEIELKERGGSKQSECSKIVAANGLQSPPSPLEAKQRWKGHRHLYCSFIVPNMRLMYEPLFKRWDCSVLTQNIVTRLKHWQTWYKHPLCITLRICTLGWVTYCRVINNLLSKRDGLKQQSCYCLSQFCGLTGSAGWLFCWSLLGLLCSCGSCDWGWHIHVALLAFLALWWRCQ